MKYIFLLLATIISMAFLPAHQAYKSTYKCMPCGYDCDKQSYSAAGTCAHCGMELVLESNIKFKEVSPEKICDYIKQHPGSILLDVRTKEEFEGTATPGFGTLKGAINIPIQELNQRITELEPFKGKEILVFCSHSHRSPQAAYVLNQHGFKKVLNMSGGMSVLEDTRCKK